MPWPAASAAATWRCRWSALQALCPRPLLRIGLSATQKPIEKVARFLVGASGNPRDPACRIVDIGYTRPRDLGIEVPPVALEAVMSNDTWELVYDRLAHLAGEHRTTLVFVNTRRMAERVTRFLAERLGSRQVAAHHGSLAKELRLDAEQRLKAGQLKVLVATASLELGIDIGDVELVCQLSSPRSIAAFLQRVGRSGHSVGGTPKGRLFPTSRDDLVECAALLDSVRRGELDGLVLPRQPLDVLAQQIVAEVACQEWREDDLYRLVIRAEPLRRAGARALRRSPADACRGLPLTPRRARRLSPSRCAQRPAPWPPWRAADRADLGRDHSRYRRLQRALLEPQGPAGGDGQRRFRGGEPGRRCVPAGQHLVPDHPHRAGTGTGRGRPGPAAEHSVLAG